MMYREIRLNDEAEIVAFSNALDSRRENGELIRAMYVAANAEDFDAETLSKLGNVIAASSRLTLFRAWFDPFSSSALSFWASRAGLFSASLELLRLSNTDPVSGSRSSSFLCNSTQMQEDGLNESKYYREDDFFWDVPDAWRDVAAFAGLKAISIVTYVDMLDDEDDDEEAHDVVNNLDPPNSAHFRTVHLHSGVEQQNLLTSFLEGVPPETFYLRKERVWVWEESKDMREEEDPNFVCGTWVDRSHYSYRALLPKFGGYSINTWMDPFGRDVRMPPS